MSVENMFGPVPHNYPPAEEPEPTEEFVPLYHEEESWDGGPLCAPGIKYQPAENSGPETTGDISSLE